MSSSRLFLTGIRASGHHGASPGEKDEAQEFVVDLDLEVEVGADDIHETADYRELTKTVRETVASTSFDLLESLAQAVAGAVGSRPRVVRATAVIHKPRAAESLGIQGVAAATSGEG